MSVIPLLICVYITSTYVFPITEWAVGPLSLIIGITLFIALLGLMVAKRMVDPIIDMALEAKLIASGDFERSIDIAEGDEDEVGELAHSLNSMTNKIRSYISELKSYGEKTREINEEINKKVMVLSGLLQIGNLISAGTELKTVIDILVEKITILGDSNPASIMLADEEGSMLVPITVMNFEGVESANMPVSMQHGIFARLKSDAVDIIIDKNADKDDDEEKFRELYNVKNSAIIPIIVRGKIEGALLACNNEEEYIFTDDEIELLHVFAKQAAIAVENDHLLKRAEELEIKDELTKLYNARYIRDRLEEELNRALMHQRPCAFLLFNMDDFKEFCKNHGRMQGESLLKKIAKLFSNELTPSDKAGRFTDDEFALILPERNKKEAKDIGNDLRGKISEIIAFQEADGEPEYMTVSAGLSENPIDGQTAKELIDKAKGKLEEAKKAGKNTLKV